MKSMGEQDMNEKIKNEDNFCNCPFYNPKPMPLGGSSQVIYCKTCGKLILVERAKKVPHINRYMRDH